MTPVSQTVESAGLSTTYRREGSGEPLMFIGGVYLTGKWLPFHAALAQSFDVIVVDHLGFGDTDLPPTLSSWTDVAIHYADLLDALELGQVHLAGHGFGGWVAAEVAAVYPERLLSLTLLAPWGLRPDADEPLVNVFRTTDDEELALTLGADAGHWRDELLEAEPPAQMLRSFKERTSIAKVAWNPRYDLKLQQRLKRVGAPALVLIPDHDGIVSPSVPRQFSECLTNSELVTISGSQTPTEHLFLVQEPAATAAAIAKLTPANLTTAEAL